MSQQLFIYAVKAEKVEEQFFPTGGELNGCDSSHITTEPGMKALLDLGLFQKRSGFTKLLPRNVYLKETPSRKRSG